MPRRSPGGDAAIWVSIALGVVAAVVLGLAVGQEPGVTMLVLMLGAGVLAGLATAILLWALAYRGLCYVLDDARLDVHWLGAWATVPLALVDGIYPGRRLTGSVQPAVPAWPGIYVGPGRSRGLGRLRYFATSRDAEQLTVVTTRNQSLVLSPDDAPGFRAALIARVEALGETSATSPVVASRPADTAPWTTLRDRWAGWCLGATVALLVAGLAFVTLRYGLLPDRLPLRVDAAGRPIELGSRADLLRLPMGGLAAALLNWLLGVWLHPREPVLARLLWLMGAVIMAAVLLALVWLTT